MARNALTTIATRHQVFLERLKTSEALSFTEVMPKIEQAISEVLFAGQATNLSKLRKAELSSLLTELRAEQQLLIDKNNTKFLERMRKLAGYESGFEARALEAGLAGAIKRLSLVIPSAEQAYRAALQSPLSATGQLLQPFISEWGKRQIAGVDNAVRRAWGEGRTIGQLVQEFRGTKARGYRDGLFAASRRQAEAVARTSVQHVASSARDVTWARNSDVVKGYIWVSTLDARTTATCRSLDGKRFQLGQGPKPPIHINCRSTTVADVGSEYDFLDKGATRASKDGPVNAQQTYYGWLKKQPAAFQDIALGPTRGKLFRNGGLSAEKFAELNIGRNFQPLTLAEMAKLEPHAFAQANITVPKG